MFGFGKKKRPIGDAFSEALTSIQSERAPSNKALGFSEFQQTNPVPGFDEFVKPAKTPIAQPKPVDQIRHRPLSVIRYLEPVYPS